MKFAEQTNTLKNGYTQHVSLHSNIQPHHHYGQVHRLHPLHPSCKVTLNSLNLKKIHLNPKSFVINDNIYATKHIDFGRYQDTIQTISPYDLFGILKFSINENGNLVDKEYKFPFGLHESFDVMELSQKSKERVYKVNDKTGQAFNLYDQQGSFLLAFEGASSFEDLADEISEVCASILQCEFDVGRASFKFKFNVASPNITLISTPFSRFLGFKNFDVVINDIPTTIQGERIPLLQKLDLRGVNFHNNEALLQKITEQFSGVRLPEGSKIQLITENKQTGEDDSVSRFKNLPTYLTKSNLKATLLSFNTSTDPQNPDDILTVRINESSISIFSRKGRMKLRTFDADGLPLNISAFAVNSQRYLNNLTLPSSLPYENIGRNLTLNLDSQNNIILKPGPLSTSMFFLSGGHLFSSLFNPAEGDFGGTNTLENEITFQAGLNNGRVTVSPGDISKLDRFSNLNFFDVEFTLESGEVWSGILKNVSTSDTNKIYETRPLFEKTQASIRVHVPFEHVSTSPVALYFPNDILSRHILNVAYQILYIDSQTSVQLNFAPLKDSFKDAFCYVKLIDFPMKTNWNIFTDRYGFMDNIIAKAGNQMVSTKVTLNFSSSISNLYFILIDEFGNLVHTNTSVLVDLELDIM